MIALRLTIIFIFSFLLIKSSELVIISLKKISAKTKTGVFALSAIIMAIGTSLPELFLGITAALDGSPNLSLGNVIGANIANITLVAGISALAFAKSVHIRKDYLHKDVGIALIAGIAPIILIFDKSLSRVDGLVLLSVYGIYATSIFKKRYVEIAKGNEVSDYFHKILRSIPIFDGKNTKELGRLFLGIALLLFSGNIIVENAEWIAHATNIPIFLVGLIILSIGTTLPEIAFSAKSLRDHEPSMFLGNLLGSIIANSTFVIGLVAVISPIKIQAFQDYTVAACTFLLVFLLFWFFIKSKHRLDRWEAFLLLTLYIIFVFLEFM